MRATLKLAMKARSAIGSIILLLSATLVGAQQVETPVLRAAAAPAESSSRPDRLNAVVAVPTAKSSKHAREYSLRLSDGNNWLHSGAMFEPAPSANGACLKLAVAKYSATPQSALEEVPGGGLSLRDFNMQGEFTREHMIKMAHNFVPSKPLPDAPSYTPMTSKEKFEGWAKHTYSADMLMGTVFDTLILQATGAYRDYGGGMEGFTKRYGNQLLSNEAGSLFGRWFFPTVLHQDPRYFPSHESRVLDRMAYAVSRTVITRSDNGRNVFNSSLLLTLLFTSALNNGYKPNYEKSFPATMANTFAGLGGTAQMNLLNEFWPDLKQIFTRHEPKPARYVSRKVNELVDGHSQDSTVHRQSQQ